MPGVVTWDWVGPDPFRLDPFFGIGVLLVYAREARMLRRVWRDEEVHSAAWRPPTSPASHGFGVKIPPFHAEVLGVGFGFLPFWQFCQNWAKTSAWDGGFGQFWQFCQNGPKLTACLTWI